MLVTVTGGRRPDVCLCKMKPVILCTLFGYISVGIATACKTPTNLEGECIRIDDCEKLKPLIKEDREYLKKWHCGYEDTVPMVCCPIKTPTDRCDTFSGKEGTCVPVKSCPSLRKRLIKPVSSENLDYVHRSRCDINKDWYVCCDVSELAAENRDQGGDADAAAGSCDPAALLPDRDNKCCGVDSSTSNKIIGGVATAIDAYPWLAIIEYSRSRPLLCGGSLISGRYVLTAAHCLVSLSKASLEAESVRLGEYNVTNSGEDCVETDGGGKDCTTGAVSIKIESTIIHPEYNSDKTLYNVNDIALIRLVELAPFGEFIKPICLPATDVTTSPPANLSFVIAGWGYINDRRTSDVKLEANVPFFGKEACNKKYSRSDKEVLGSGQICAGGEDKDSCRGDSGGPLSYYQEDKPQEIVGIISFGLQQCGVVDSPSIYTKVYEYLPWIQSNMKP